MHSVTQVNSWSNLEVLSCNKSQVGRNPITVPHFNYITDHQFFGMNAAFLSLSYHYRKLQQSFEQIINRAV